MAIFGNLELELIVQVNDKTRLDATKSYVTTEETAITLMEIETDTAAGFIDITAKQYYDFQYATDGDKTISLRITTDGAPITSTSTLSIISVTDDKLFSSDPQLLPYEPNILNWVRTGRNTFIDVHRESQTEILNYLDKNGYWDINGDALTKDAVIDIQEFRDWSKFMTLKLIFEGISNAIDDVFHDKAIRYRDKEYDARDRAILRVDLDDDGDSDQGEDLDMRSISLVME